MWLSTILWLITWINTADHSGLISVHSLYFIFVAIIFSFKVKIEMLNCFYKNFRKLINGDNYDFQAHLFGASLKLSEFWYLLFFVFVCVLVVPEGHTSNSGAKSKRSWRGGGTKVCAVHLMHHICLAFFRSAHSTLYFL